jgi:hypothetical protein
MIVRNHQRLMRLRSLGPLHKMLLTESRAVVCGAQVGVLQYSLLAAAMRGSVLPLGLSPECHEQVHACEWEGTRNRLRHTRIEVAPRMLTSVFADTGYQS